MTASEQSTARWYESWWLIGISFFSLPVIAFCLVLLKKQLSRGKKTLIALLVAPFAIVQLAALTYVALNGDVQLGGATAKSSVPHEAILAEGMADVFAGLMAAKEADESGQSPNQGAGVLSNIIKNKLSGHEIVGRHFTLDQLAKFRDLRDDLAIEKFKRSPTYPELQQTIAELIEDYKATIWVTPPILIESHDWSKEFGGFTLPMHYGGATIKPAYSSGLRLKEENFPEVKRTYRYCILPAATVDQATQFQNTQLTLRGHLVYDEKTGPFGSHEVFFEAEKAELAKVTTPRHEEIAR